MMEFDIEEFSLKDLSGRQISILRSMTLKSAGSMMRRTLNEDRIDETIKVAIAKYKNHYLGWALAKKYWNDRMFIMVFVRPQYRRKGIGSALTKHFRKRGIKFCYRWDEVSSKFYDHMGLANVYR